MNNEWNVLYISEKADRNAICMILACNGYTVRQGRRKRTPTGTAYIYYVEYRRNQNE